jgi:hypothetical protein
MKYLVIEVMTKATGVVNKEPNKIFGSNTTKTFNRITTKGNSHTINTARNMESATVLELE